MITYDFKYKTDVFISEFILKKKSLIKTFVFL